MDIIVTVIKQHDPDSWSGGPGIFRAVADSEEHARQWIQDEVDGKHPDSGHSYASGQSVDWWIKYGTFTLEDAVLYGITMESLINGGLRRTETKG
jgi:hypothetical protein